MTLLVKIGAVYFKLMCKKDAEGFAYLLAVMKKAIQGFLLYICVTDPERVKECANVYKSVCETETNLCEN